MNEKCPNCKKPLEYLNVSQQLEGKRSLIGVFDLEWNEEQKEPLVHTCPLCHTEISEEQLKEWGYEVGNW